MIEKIKQFNKERAVWNKAGRPYRPADRILEIYSICEECPNFNKTRFGDSCEVCGCRLHPKDTIMPNKIAWATTECPEGKWGADVEIENIELDEADIKSEAEAPERPITADRNIRKGCNCK